MKIQGRTLRVGTLEYMSSETVLAKGHDKATEWWSVGILLYEMLTGKVSMHLLARAPMLLVVT
jgi:serine/threonine protein kinase